MEYFCRFGSDRFRQALATVQYGLGRLKHAR